MFRGLLRDSVAVGTGKRIRRYVKTGQIVRRQRPKTYRKRRAF